MRRRSTEARPGMPLDRRTFLAFTLGGVATAAGCAGIAAVPVPVERGRVRVRLADHPGLERAGGFLKIRPTGSENPLYVLADGEGGYEVVSPICTHKGCTVDVRGVLLVCPCHGSRYTRSGDVVKGPAQRPLDRYPAKVERGFLEIGLTPEA